MANKEKIIAQIEIDVSNAEQSLKRLKETSKDGLLGKKGAKETNAEIQILTQRLAQLKSKLPGISSGEKEFKQFYSAVGKTTSEIEKCISKMTGFDITDDYIKKNVKEVQNYVSELKNASSALKTLQSGVKNQKLHTYQAPGEKRKSQTAESIMRQAAHSGNTELVKQTGKERKAEIKSRMSELSQDSLLYKQLQQDLATITEVQKQFVIQSLQISEALLAEGTAADKLSKALAGPRAEMEATQQSLQSDLDDVIKSLKNAANGADEMGQSFDQIKQSGKTIGELGDRLASLLSVTSIFYAIRRVVKDVVADFKELDKQFNEIAIVSDKSTSEMWEQFSSVNEIAQKFGVTTSNVLEVQNLYYHQGKDVAEVTKLTAQTLTLAKITGMDYARATSDLTAALNAYNLKAEEAGRVTDTIAAMDTSAAISSEELMTALTKTASIAANAGMSLENTEIFLTKMIETTREAPENLGTALKTIIARFGEVKEEIDGEFVELADINRVDTALKTVGVTLLDTTGQIRDLDDVFLELSSKWDGLDRNTQRYIATIAAGSRQQSRFIALMENYDRTLELTDAMQNSSGIGARQLAKSMESIETAMNTLKSSWQEFTQKFLKNKMFTTVLNAANKLLDVLNEIPAPILAIVGVVGAWALKTKVLDKALIAHKIIQDGLLKGEKAQVIAKRISIAWQRKEQGILLKTFRIMKELNKVKKASLKIDNKQEKLNKIGKDGELDKELVEELLKLEQQENAIKDINDAKNSEILTTIEQTAAMSQLTEGYDNATAALLRYEYALYKFKNKNKGNVLSFEDFIAAFDNSGTQGKKSIDINFSNLSSKKNKMKSDKTPKIDGGKGANAGGGGAASGIAGLFVKAGGGLSKTGIIGIIIAAVLAVIAAASIITWKLTESSKDDTKDIEALEKAQESYNKDIQKYKTLQEKVRRLNEINSSVKTFESREEEQSIIQEILEDYPLLLDYIDEEGNYHLKNSEEIQREIAKQKELMAQSQKTYQETRRKTLRAGIFADESTPAGQTMAQLQNYFSSFDKKQLQALAKTIDRDDLNFSQTEFVKNAEAYQSGEKASFNNKDFNNIMAGFSISHDDFNKLAQLYSANLQSGLTQKDAMYKALISLKENEDISTTYRNIDRIAKTWERLNQNTADLYSDLLKNYSSETEAIYLQEAKIYTENALMGTEISEPLRDAIANIYVDRKKELMDSYFDTHGGIYASQETFESHERLKDLRGELSLLKLEIIKSDAITSNMLEDNVYKSNSAEDVRELYNKEFEKLQQELKDGKITRSEFQASSKNLSEEENQAINNAEESANKENKKSLDKLNKTMDDKIAAEIKLDWNGIGEIIGSRGEIIEETFRNIGLTVGDMIAWADGSYIAELDTHMSKEAEDYTNRLVQKIKEDPNTREFLEKKVVEFGNTKVTDAFSDADWDPDIAAIREYLIKEREEKLEDLKKNLTTAEQEKLSDYIISTGLQNKEIDRVKEVYELLGAAAGEAFLSGLEIISQKEGLNGEEELLRNKYLGVNLANLEDVTNYLSEIEALSQISADNFKALEQKMISLSYSSGGIFFGDVIEEAERLTKRFEDLTSSFENFSKLAQGEGDFSGLGIYLRAVQDNSKSLEALLEKSNKIISDGRITTDGFQIYGANEYALEIAELKKDNIMYQMRILQGMINDENSSQEEKMQAATNLTMYRFAYGEVDAEYQRQQRDKLIEDLKKQEEQLKKTRDALADYVTWLREYDKYANLDRTIENLSQEKGHLDFEINFSTNTEVIKKDFKEKMNNINSQIAANQGGIAAAEEEELMWKDIIQKQNSKYVSFGENGEAIVNAQKMQKLQQEIVNAEDERKEILQNEYDEIMSNVEAYNKAQNKVESYTQALQKNFEELQSFLNGAYQNVKDIEDKLIELRMNAEDKELEAVREKYSAIQNENNKYLDSVREMINKERQIRVQEKNEEDVAKKEKKLAMMKMDTSGIYTRDIQSLEEELKQDYQNLEDEAIDRSVQELEEDFRQQEEGYAKDIEFMENSLEYKREKMTEYNTWATQLIQQGSDAVLTYLKANDEEYYTGSAAAQALWESEWNGAVTRAMASNEFLKESLTLSVINTLNSCKDSATGFEGAVTQYSKTAVIENGKVKDSVSDLKDQYKLLAIGVSGVVTQINKLRDAYSLAADAAADLNKQQGTEIIGQPYAKAIEDPISLEDYNKTNGTDFTSNVAESIEGSDEQVKDRVKYIGWYADNMELTDIVAKTADPNNDTWYVFVSQLGGWVTVGADDTNQKNILYSNGSEINANTWKEAVNDPSKLPQKVKVLGDARIAYITKKFATGGFADFTGPAWLDGTKSRPEAVLNALQTKHFIQFTNVLDTLFSGHPNLSTVSHQPQNSGDTNYTFHIKVDQMASDYDVDRLVERIEEKMVKASRYRNVTTLTKITSGM